jgi:phosphoribosyl-AMP cyclohydrolase / phosphoribosyl-ATP pyrophosphohydrolase
MEYLSANPDQLDFTKSPDGLIPAVIQDTDTQKVLMLGYMNADALQQTLQTGKVTFFSRSKQRLWVKGETSGHFLLVDGEILVDCDQDTLLIRVIPQGPVCHTGADTCWNEKNQNDYFLPHLEAIIHQRMTESPDHSYTARLMSRGLAKVAQKVGEEAVETVIEALGDNRELLLEESADLLFHFLVLLAAKDVELKEVEAVLRRRNQR